MITGQAQPITPVWEYTLKNLPAPIPVLTNTLNGWTTDLESGDGLSLMDCIGPMRRYDANRLLIGIRENGIDETVAHNTNLANAYPDRSLIWINPTNGQPMGLALNVGLFPVALDPDAVANEGVPGSYYWSFDVSEDGYIYTGYENFILRYAPNGSGGILPTPTIVFTLDQATAVAAGQSVAQWANYRWANIRVRGSGANTTILAGGLGSRYLWLLKTADGNTFTAGGHMAPGFGNAAGNISNFIPDPTGASPDDIAFYGGSYPGNSSGADTKLYKAIGIAPFTDPANTFFNDGTFSAKEDPNTNNLTRYLTLFQGSCDVHPDVDFVVNYSTPPYNSPTAAPHQPGWLAIHNRTNGDFIASYQLPCSDLDEYLPADSSMLFIGAVGSVSLYPLADGTAEVLWSSEVFGYGRYIVGTPRYTKAAAMSKTIKPLWEQLQGQPNVLPIIDTDVESVPAKDGSSAMHVFTGFKKYDATRMLLAIRDNGINETVAHNTNLALAYPDRSLQWINAETGNPMGTALVVSYAPTPISDDNALYMAFGVSADGVLYVGVADKILRYAPSGGGFAAPTVAFTLPGTDPQPAKTQFAEFRVSGSGASTVIVVASRNWWGSSDRILTTADGLTYTETETVPTQGGISSVVPDPAGTGDNVLFKTLYPATSNGIDSTMNRRRQVGGTGPFGSDSFPVEQVAGSTITNSVDVIYRSYFLTDVQALSGQDWVLAYSTPSFRTFNNSTVQSALKGSSPDPMPYQPGWLAIHDQVTGEVRGLRKLNVTEALNVIPSTTGAPEDFTTGWFSYAIPQGGVELYPVLNAASEVAGVEILWWSATYGFGRYYVDTPPAASHLLGTQVGGGIKLEWKGAGVLQSASNVQGPYADEIAVSSGYVYS
ncbi:MAG: hypothetical protein KBH45_02335, partial [Verrucomicrobia bacterium]|nr:hypothetical protein [Verrucomicrobiota bacterium]